MEIQEIKMFQFYLSSIKSYGGYGSRVYNPLFQFYLSSIKSNNVVRYIKTEV